MNRHTGIVKELLDKGFPVNATDVHGWTPLHCACHCGDIEIAVEGWIKVESIIGAEGGDKRGGRFLQDAGDDIHRQRLHRRRRLVRPL